MLRGGRRSWQALQRSVPPPPPQPVSCLVAPTGGGAWLARGAGSGHGRFQTRGSGSCAPGPRPRREPPVVLFGLRGATFLFIPRSLPLPPRERRLRPPPPSGRPRGWQSLAGCPCRRGRTCPCVGSCTLAGPCGAQSGGCGGVAVRLVRGFLGVHPPQPPPPPWGLTLKDGVEAVTTPPRFPGRTPVVGEGGAPTGPPGGAWSGPATVATRPPLRGRPRRQQPTAPGAAGLSAWRRGAQRRGGLKGGRFGRCRFPIFSTPRSQPLCPASRRWPTLAPNATGPCCTLLFFPNRKRLHASDVMRESKGRRARVHTALGERERAALVRDPG